MACGSETYPPFFIRIYYRGDERHFSHVHLARRIEVRALDDGIVASAAPVSLTVVPADSAFSVELRALIQKARAAIAEAEPADIIAGAPLSDRCAHALELVNKILEFVLFIHLIYLRALLLREDAPLVTASQRCSHQTY